MKVVILCGGKGTRLREETEYIPKPMVRVGGKPILWHIMSYYASFGYNEFVLCLGYKGEIIKDYFRNYFWNESDVTVSLNQEEKATFHEINKGLDWKVTLANTGEDSMTAYRVKLIQKYIEKGESFMLTYGDGVCSVDIDALVNQHKNSSNICTISGVHPAGRFGELSIENDNIVGFNEKPQVEGGYINGGYMVCDYKMFDYLPDDPGMMLEQEPIKNVVRDGKMGVFKHEGFWQCMDTYAEMTFLNNLWKSGNCPWKIW